MPASTHASSRRSGQSLGQRTACNGGREGKKEGSAALLVSPFIFGPGIFLATASGEREIGSCSADLLSLSRPSLPSAADFTCLSRRRRGRAWAAAAASSWLLLLLDSTLTECDFLTNYNCDPLRRETRLYRMRMEVGMGNGESGRIGVVHAATQSSLMSRWRRYFPSLKVTCGGIALRKKSVLSWAACMHSRPLVVGLHFLAFEAFGRPTDRLQTSRPFDRGRRPSGRPL